MWRATTLQPLIMKKNQHNIEGQRWARRPSALIKSVNKRYASEEIIADTYSGSTDDFSSGDMMPDETMQEDTGWKPGPVVRNLPEFHGPRPGPTDPSINEQSSARSIMAGLLTKEFKFFTSS